ncbi:MAG TPA: hypothetical protein DDY43_04915 [Synechococcales bacterium UBA10510]|nr:hypothetical protein [Synechococcales bacterium UBA10510]
MLLLILAANLALALAPTDRGNPGANRNQRLAITDDSPELLRFSRSQSLAMVLPGGNLANMPGGLATLPPPPTNLPLVKAGNLPEMSSAKGPSSQAPVGPGKSGGSAFLMNLAPPGLPDRASVALEALRQLVGPATTGTDPDSGLGRDQLAAIQRRQWWLSSGQEPILQQLWQAGVSVSQPPTPLADLPAAVELRRLPAGVTGRLGLPEPHGHSLVGRNTAVLLWRLGSEVWALRLPLGEALTKS